MISIPLGPIPIRLLLLLLLAGGLGMLGWSVVRTAIGESVMTFVQRAPNLSAEDRIEGADMAARYSPGDPLIHWRRGGVYMSAAAEEQAEARLAAALEEFRRAVRMSPDDYRGWMALGRAEENNGDMTGARKAFERAVELAPRHFDPRWAFGNHLLRADDRAASFAQMRLALGYRPSALPLVFDYAWNAFNGNGKAIIAALDPANELKPRMIVLMIERGRVEDAMELWRGMAAPTPDDIQRVSEALVNAGRFSAAWRIWSGANPPDRPAPDAGSLLSNGDFERQISLNATTPFYTWRLTPGGLFKLSLDRKDPHGGKQALRAGFNLGENMAFTIATQLVPVRPSTSYRLSFWVRTEDMEALSTPFVELYDPALDVGVAGRPRAATPQLPNYNNVWHEYRLDLTTQAATEALKVRIVRLPCPVPPCTINGRLWFDDFKLTELDPSGGR
ncbi:MAG: tetratricopeptide repeat protein [Blastocatellia bacterium]